MTVTLKKVALRREDGPPMGTPAPCYLVCPCGRKVAICDARAQPVNRNDAGEHVCECGQAFDSRGWLQPDEFKPMRSIRVTWDDGDTTTTTINGTRADIIAYYVGNYFNVGAGELDAMKQGKRVEFLD